jgi:ankyrin repeat protein
MKDTPDIEDLIKSVVDRDSTRILEVVSSGVDVNQVGVQGRSPLMVASAEGCLEMVKLLTRSGASLSVAGIQGVTALHEAAANGHASIIEYFLSLEPIVDAETSQGVTPLMCAAAWGNLEAVELLLKSGADRTKRDCRGATAADIAHEKGEDEAADAIGQ